MSKFDGLITAKPKQGDAKKAVSKKTVAQAEATASTIATSAGQKNTKARTLGKRSDPNYTQITAYIKKDTHENVMRKIYKQKEFSELVEELLTDWMNNSK